MDDTQYLFEILAGFVYLAVGIGLLRLSRRSGEVPERRLGVHYVCAGVAYLLYEFPIVEWVDSVWITFAARVIYAAGCLPLLCFARDVFRKGALWAFGLTWGAGLILFVGIGFSVLGGDLEGFNPGNLWFWYEWVGFTVPFAWICIESILAYLAARKRVQVGLCAPLVANRFLLLAGFGAFETIGSFTLIALYREYAITQVWPAWGDYLVGGCPAVAAALIWFVFFPPAPYRRWLKRFTPAGVANG